MTGCQAISSLRLEIQKIDHLPTMPSIAQEILIASNDLSSGLGDIVKKDPYLIANIIGMSDSAFFGFKRKVTTLEQAIINVLGLDLVKVFALSLSRWIVPQTFSSVMGETTSNLILIFRNNSPQRHLLSFPPQHR